MRFAPKSEEEIDTRVLLPAGEYDATVTQATDEVSKSSQKEQIHLVLKVEDDQGQRNIVHDYLLEAMAGKLRHFCAAADLMSEYESGELDAGYCTNQTVRVRLGIEKGKGEYQDKNVVKDYLPRNGNGHRPAQPVQPQRQQQPQTGSAEGAAKKAFLTVWSKFITEFPSEIQKRDEYWKKCFNGFFPGKLASALTPAEWSKFQQELPKWDPMNGWPAKPAPFSPDTFQEDDIPF